jgi:hypothetical protein
MSTERRAASPPEIPPNDVPALIRAERDAHQYRDGKTYSRGFNDGYQLGIDRAALVAEQALRGGTPAGEGSPQPLMAIRKRDDSPVETVMSEAAHVRDWYERASLQWTETYLCEIIDGPGPVLRGASQPGGTPIVPGAGLTPDEEVLVNALRSVVGGSMTVLGRDGMGGLLRIIERLSRGRPEPEGGRLTEALRSIADCALGGCEGCRNLARAALRDAPPQDGERLTGQGEGKNEH